MSGSAVFASLARGPRFLVDLGATLLVWGYFTLGFLAVFSPFYLITALMPGHTAIRHQYLNHIFYQGFFALCRILMPRQRWEIDPKARNIRASVVVCNHISYMDPLLLISLFRRHTTLVKARLFRIPVFGQMLRLAGYIPASSDADMAGLMLERLETLCADLEKGANLVVFPEGTRSRDGHIGPFNTGAFKIARRCRRPIQILLIRNTRNLFMPGRFLFNTWPKNTISIQWVGGIMPAYDAPDFSVSRLAHAVREKMMAAQDGLLQEESAEQI